MRVAMISAHTSPLEQPGTGDAGGMNVYVMQLAQAMGDLGAAVEVFTRRTKAAQPDHVEAAQGVWVHHIDAGPYEGLNKNDLPAQMCYFTAGMLRYEASRRQHWFDAVHSHYWLSGMAGWLAADRWSVPLIHTMHTLAKAKNRNLAPRDIPEPKARVVGEQQVVLEADRLVVSTPSEAEHLRTLYGAVHEQIAVVPPGVRIDSFHPLAGHDQDEQKRALRRELGVSPDRPLVVYAGRIQPLKGTDVLVRAWGHWRREYEQGRWPEPPQLLIIGGSSGAKNHRKALRKLVAEEGIGADVALLDPLAHPQLARTFQAADLVAVPSYYETFGLVGLEAQACGTPVVAADVGGLSTVVSDGVSGELVAGHDPQVWAARIRDLLHDRDRLARMSAQARVHAEAFSWEMTARRMLRVYQDANSATGRASA
ncbi:D-inositol-3-phosphate glycosyltransferase [Micrococcales bacterium KH10]|nr:D-inositol-3-phosphate glycosyltransferase [Micrococcales bacterium KH10]